MVGTGQPLTLPDPPAAFSIVRSRTPLSVPAQSVHSVPSICPRCPEKQKRAGGNSLGDGG